MSPRGRRIAWHHSAELGDNRLKKKEEEERQEIRELLVEEAYSAFCVCKGVIKGRLNVGFVVRRHMADRI